MAIPSVVILTSNPETAGDLRFDSIQFGKNLIYIYRFAMFGECENVTELSFPAKVKSIQESFHNCKSLSRLEFGEEFYYADVSLYKCESLKEFQKLQVSGRRNIRSDACFFLIFAAYSYIIFKV
ncbi:MAG: leucine-rich repeat protein [Lachnospiraceae bacterium]|nr:leucine-rich repeat protein [Lachnospiraceae bacterium]